MRPSPTAASACRPTRPSRSATATATSSTGTTATARSPQQVVPAADVAMMNNMLTHVVVGGHRHAGPARQRHGRGQDRHDQQLPRRLVLRLHRQLRRRRLVRQRRLHVDEQDDRRHAAGHDLARHHGLRASGHRDPPALRPRRRSRGLGHDRVECGAGAGQPHRPAAIRPSCRPARPPSSAVSRP